MKFPAALFGSLLALTPCLVAPCLITPCLGEEMLEPPNTKYFGSKGSWGQPQADQWGLAKMGFDASPQSAWRLLKKNTAPVIVALVDTGLDWNHRSIDWDNIWRNPDEQINGIDDDKNGKIDDVIGWDFYARNHKPWDYDGHGTMVAGIVAGSWKDTEGIAGINPFAKLMILKAVNNFGHTRASYVAEAIVYAADHGARVINLSVGGQNTNKIATAAIDYAYKKGAVIVVAAGNEGVNIENHGLASSDKVLVVGASTPDDQHANFSNWGKISLAAPGIDILSLRARRTDTLLSPEAVKYVPGTNYVGADKRYYRASGTSFSAPFVTGLASLMIANDPTLTNLQVMNILKSTARDIGPPGVDQFTGYGLPDARAALSAPKDYFLFAGIARVSVAQAGANQVVRVFGTADADVLKDARIEIGQGENPKSFKTISAVKKTAGPDEALGDIPTSALAGSKTWTIRVVVEHRDGRQQQARFKLNLG
jgi:subtilisin family serine protease